MSSDESIRRQRQREDLLGLGRRGSAIDEVLKANRPLSEQLGLGGGYAIDQALKATRPLSEVIGLGRRSAIDEFISGSALTRARIDSIGSVLRARDAFSTGVIDGSLAKVAENATAGIGASVAAIKYREQIETINDRISRDVFGVGTFHKHFGGIDHVTRAFAAERAQVAAITRAARWATGIEGRTPDALSSILKSTRGIEDQIGQLTRTAAGIVEAGDLASRATRSLVAGGIRDTTVLKLSAFAGSLDLFGPRASAGQAAFDSLLGTWQMRPDLPASFFRDPYTRARYYREAEVDEGLIDAENAEVIDVLVESGVVAGERTASGIWAFVDVGPLRMTITTRRARYDAFRAIDGFEVSLRAFVGTKLAAYLASRGEDASKWFTLRAGWLVGEAKKTRREAYKAGEAPQPLINFTNLGDLITVITSNRNWDEVFGAVFDDRNGFKIDLQRLNAHRRPAMQARLIDGPRLAEILLTIRRLTAMMEADGAWTDGWDDDA